MKSLRKLHVNQVEVLIKDGTRLNAVVKRLNPIGSNGYPFRCHCCGSVCHMVQGCPDSYENIEKVQKSAAEDIEDCWLFTGSKTEFMQHLVGESSHSAALNSACSSTVAEEWLKCYFDTLHPESLAQVTQEKSHTVFKFGDSQLKSMEKVQFPCEIAGQKCFITTDVVKK